MDGELKQQDSYLDRYLVELVKSGELELREKWVNRDAAIRTRALELFPKDCSNHRVFDERERDRPKNVVTIRSIRGSPYEDTHDRDGLAIYAGGPGSMVAAALDSVRGSETKEKGNPNVLFATYDFEHSNARSSAYYFHIRHSSALDADERTRGGRILTEFIRRKFITKDTLVLEARAPSYLKVDLSADILSSPSHALTTLGILVLGFWHTLRNVAIEKVSPRSTDWALNRTYSQNSAPIFRYLESAAEGMGVCSESNGKPTLLTGTEGDGSNAEAIHVVFNETDAEYTERENQKVLKTNGIVSKSLTSHELTQLMGGETNGIYKSYVYPGDGRIAADMNLILRDIVRAACNRWQEGAAVDSVYVGPDGVRGVLFRDVQTSEKWYQPCSSLVLSLGYTSRYKYELPSRNSQPLSSLLRHALSSLKLKVGLANPVPRTTTAAGCSGYFLVKGRIPIIGAQNAHWTEVAYSREADVTLAKLTCGGNIGSEHIQAAYALNNLELLRNLFGDRLIGILSIDSCPRAINPQNDVRFYELAPRFAVSIGLGGTGMTKSGANAAFSYLLSNPTIKQSEVIPTAPDLFSSVDLEKFVTRCSDETMRTLGLRNDYSSLELLSGIGISVGVYFGVRKLSKWKSSPVHPTRGGVWSVSPSFRSGGNTFAQFKNTNCIFHEKPRYNNFSTSISFSRRGSMVLFNALKRGFRV